jgi:thioredoxin-related protein
MRRAASLLLAAASFALSAALSTDAGAAAPHDGAVPWIDGDPASVDAAFAQARAAHKPLFLYWGAIWCPPCNQVKATVFNRQDFAERAHYFVPVYVDGDSPGAQKLGDRFGVTAYPTMILFAPGGGEITRLPGEVDAERYMQVLALGIGAGRPVKTVLAAALARDPHLGADDWRMLAYYSWDTDDQRLVAAARLPATLRALAAACPAAQPDAAARLDLRALVAAAQPADPKKAPAKRGAAPSDRAAALGRVTALLADAHRARDNFDLVTGYPAELTALLTAPDTPERSTLATDWDRTLVNLQGDSTLSTADRLGALIGRVQLARLLAPAPAPLPDALLAEVRHQVDAANHATTDVYERQSVISAAADALSESGLFDESDALLTAELARSHSPYYFMLDLAANANKRGDSAAALDWDEKAYNASVGPATRLQWGTIYLRALIEHAPQDEARIGRALGSVLGELDPAADTFHARNSRALARITSVVANWNRGHAHDQVVLRAREQLASVCARLPAGAPERGACRGVLASGPHPAGA